MVLTPRGVRALDAAAGVDVAALPAAAEIAAFANARGARPAPGHVAVNRAALAQVRVCVSAFVRARVWMRARACARLASMRMN